MLGKSFLTMKAPEDQIATTGFFKGMSPTMSILAFIMVGAFILFAGLAPEQASTLFSIMSGWIIANFKWYYIAVVGFFLIFSIYLLFSRYGDIRLGDDDQEPEFGNFAWFSMLFGAGMGIGLLFWSIAEPIYHLQANPFIKEGVTTEAANVAMNLTFFHWGLHPWAIYVVVGLSLSFFVYRRKLPLAIRSVFYPILKEKIYGPIGHTIDLLAIFGTIFGVATSLGLGVAQINTGLNTLMDIEVSIPNQLILIAIISAIATVSVVSGVGKGVKILSETNLYLSIVVLLIFLIWGPTEYIMNSYVQNIGTYLDNLMGLTFWTNTEGTGVSKWQSSWTTFYWGWWVSWAPFVGIFIARISKGRTIREFVFGVLLVPTLLGLFWLTAFGGTAIHMALYDGVEIVKAVNQDVTTALYFTLEHLGYSETWIPIAKGLVTILICTYFITSSDSGTFVVTSLLSLGSENPPTKHRVIWGLGEGLVAAGLLLAGGLAALQAAAIISALPFSIIMLVMCYALIRGLAMEKDREKTNRIRLSEQDASPHKALMDRLNS